MDPFETTVTELLKKRKELAETIVNSRDKIDDKGEDTRLPFNIYKTTKQLQEYSKKTLKPVPPTI